MFNRLGMFDRSLGMFQPPGSIPFNPSQIFAALQGAWLEPTPGYIWQENTGVTPTTTGGQTIGLIADQSGGGHDATQATAGNRPTYQLDSNNLPLARHDATDSLSVSLPAINVRRNLLTYSEQFDNGAWVKQGTVTVLANAAIAPDGTPTADLLSIASGNYVYQNAIVTSGSTYTYSFYVKTATGTKQFYMHVYGSPASAISAVLTATEQWQRFTFTFTPTAGGPLGIYAPVVDGLPVADLIIWGAQLELGSVATDYQKITDWTSEAYASSGSVYFATPVGMSALHNQSMGTTFTLPALSTDIYSWIVVPQRLNAAQESRLSRYMERKAGIAGPDYLLDNSDNQLTADDGIELLLAQ